MYRPSNRIFSITVVFTLLAGVGIAAAGAPQAPTPREIFDRHIEAIGGRDAIMAHSSSSATGTIEMVGQGLSGNVEVHAAAPNRILYSVTIPAAEYETRTGYDGEVGWLVDPLAGERILSGSELQQMIDEADYYSDLHEDATFISTETVGEVEFDGRAAYKVALVYQSGRETVEYFDMESGLLIGVEGMQESQMGEMMVVTTVSDYKQMGDLMVPTLLMQDIGGMQTIRTTVDTVEYDSVDPAVFELPAAIKALR